MNDFIMQVKEGGGRDKESENEAGADGKGYFADRTGEPAWGIKADGMDD